LSENDPLIVALDVESKSAAAELVAALGKDIGFYKVGMELYASAGMEFVRELLAGGKKVFLDMKFYDIPETVKRAVAQVAQSGVSFLTVHGSNSVMHAAVEGRGDTELKLLAVTVLTSFDEADLRDLGYSVPVSDLVTLRVHNAMACGITARSKEESCADWAGCLDCDAGRAVARNGSGRSEARSHTGGGDRRWSELSGDRATGHAREGPQERGSRDSQ
jgi:orotidine 5'-phosphate decarboxylase subfamily 1